MTYIIFVEKFNIVIEKKNLTIFKIFFWKKICLVNAVYAITQRLVKISDFYDN